MRILHPGVLPVRQLQLLFFVLSFIEKEIVGNGVDVSQGPLGDLRFDERLQREHPLLHRPVVPVHRRPAFPQALIKLNLPENIEFVLHFQPHLVKAPEPAHAAPQVFDRVRVAHPHTFEVPRDLIARHRVDVNRVVAETFSGDRLVDRRLLPSVDQLVRPLAGHPHDVLAASARKQKRPVGHALLEDGDLRDLVCAAAKSLRDHIQHLRLQLARAAVQFPQLLISVDLHGKSVRNHPGGNDHPALFPSGFFINRLFIQ